MLAGHTMGYEGMSETGQFYVGTRTLSHWTRLLRVPLTLDCPVMQLVCQPHGEVVFSGSGQIRIHSNTCADFVMHATPKDAGEAWKALIRAQSNPRDIHVQLGLRATEYDGTEWNGGWVPIRLGETLGNTWELRGPIQSLSTAQAGLWVSKAKGIEVIFDSKLRMPLPLNMTTLIQRGDREVLRKIEPGGKAVDVAGTRIDFFIDPELDATWAIAATSEEFPHPHAENWVSEPLCLLLGQLVFPRLVARNFGDSASIRLSLAPPIEDHSLAASILVEDPMMAPDRFWQVYQRILTMLTRARDSEGRRHFESHPLTHYYHEIIQASRGSNWVWCLTFASAIEGIAKLLTPEQELKSDYSSSEMDKLRAHIGAWSGHEGLRGRILGLLKLVESKGIIQLLNGLAAQGVGTREQVGAWINVRNQVMHGHLVAPWSDEKLEEQMRMLAELMHQLSLHYVMEQSA